jgi:hypothetical protein
MYLIFYLFLKIAHLFSFIFHLIIFASNWFLFIHSIILIHLLFLYLLYSFLIHRFLDENWDHWQSFSYKIMFLFPFRHYCMFCFSWSLRLLTFSTPFFMVSTACLFLIIFYSIYLFLSLRIFVASVNIMFFSNYIWDLTSLLFLLSKLISWMAFCFCCSISLILSSSCCFLVVKKFSRLLIAWVFCYKSFC